MYAKRIWAAAILMLLVGCGYAGSAAAASDQGFALQVSPSPLVATVRPGESKTLELKLRNTAPRSDTYTIEARGFRFDNTTGTVTLDDRLAPDIARWLTLPAAGFTIQPGQWLTQKITIAVPPEAGFSYHFALVISRSGDTPRAPAGSQLKGSVAVFTLINVDKPGATRSLQIVSITTDRPVYEYLPATVSVRLKNTGNSIVQPYGTLYIQRSLHDTSPLATMPLNDANTYLLPGSERTLTLTWDDGFPVYRTASNAGTSRTSLEWNIDRIRAVRLGEYTAKVVAAYNDGRRDVPLDAAVTFWVVPWKTGLIVLAVIVGLGLVIYRLSKARTQRAVEKALRERRRR